MNLTKTDWPLGWTPSADAVNGDPGGLLRMDNLQRDEQGVVTLVRGYTELATFSDYVSDIYSKPLSTGEAIYVGLNENGHTILRDATGTGGFTEIASGSGRASFGDALGAVICCAGSTRIKDDGSTTTQLGLTTPEPPTIGAASQPVLAFFARPSPFGDVKVNAPGQFSVILGSLGEAQSNDLWIDIINDPTTNLASAVYILPKPVDTTQIPQFTAINPALDLIECYIEPWDPTVIAQVQVDFLLDPDLTALTATQINNYYTYVWTSDNLNLTQGSDPENNSLAQTWLSAQRGAFTRIGSDPRLDWAKVLGIRFTVTCISSTEMTFGGFQIVGGAEGQLNGTYQYVQVDVNDNGNYVAMSPASQPTQPLWVINGSVSITPSVSGDNQVTESWIYRISATQAQGPLGTQSASQTSFLDQYYRVGTTKPGQQLIDNLSDNEAIQIDLTANLFLESMNASDTNGMTDTIYMIAGLFKTRMLYMGLSYIYVSDDLDPDAIDTRFTIKAFGDPMEKNLWLKKVNNNVLILATTKDLYEISGTFEQLPDGSIDITILPIGEAYPPLSYGAALVNGGIFYIAADGLRVTLGSNSNNVSPQLRLLFQGENRFGIPPFSIVSADAVRYSLTAGKTKIYFSMPCQDGTRRLVIFDTVTNQFTLRYTDPLTVYATQTDRVLLGYGQESIDPMGVFGALLLLDTGTSPLNFSLQTVYDANQQPRNRKDTFTLKLIADTGGADVSVQLDKDDSGNWTTLGQINSNGLKTSFFPLDEVTLGFRYAIKLQDVNLVSTFKLYEYTIEYEPRPEQLNYLRLLPNNLNSFARKRWTSFAYVIDTLGNQVTFQPYIDNSPTGKSDTVITETKLTHITFFDTETIGTDIGGIFSGGVFEFYGPNLEESVSEKLPTPTTFLVIPANDYGVPNRKRHTSYKFQINTSGKVVTFVPIIDEVSYPPLQFSTPSKQTVEYFFPPSAGDVIGIDIGGTLTSQNQTIPFEFYGVVIPQTIEKLPDRLQNFVIPNTDYGTPNRKRHTSYKFQINTNSQPVLYTPILDNLSYPPQLFVTMVRQTVEYFFSQANGDIISIDIGGTLEAQTSTSFEFYGTIVPQQVETLPDRLKYFVIAATDYGVPNRKRHTSYKFQINTNGQPVQFVPIVDQVSYSVRTFTTPSRQTVEYFFDIADGDVIGIDIGGTLSGTSPFEFYGTVVPQTVEKLPDRLTYFVIPANNYGAPNRKRHTSYKFQINTNGASVKFTPILDGVQYSPRNFVTPSKQTVEYFFDISAGDVIGIDIGGILQSATLPAILVDIPPYPAVGCLEYFEGQPTIYVPKAGDPPGYFNQNAPACYSLGGPTLVEQQPIPFEFYGIVIPQKVEELPDRLEYFVIPNSDYGVPNRKRHTSYKFQIYTYGANVLYTPIVDGVAGPGQIFNTSRRQTVEYFFPPGDIIGIDIGGTLASVATPVQPFEFYGTVVPQTVEKLPDRLTYFVIPANDYGVPNRKRHTSYKFQINTNGQPVEFTPIVDQIAETPLVFSTPSKQTVEFFFTNIDLIGIDIGGILAAQTTTPFEFYGVVIPQSVEKLPDRLEYLVIPSTNYGVPNRKRHTSYKFQINTNSQPVLFTPILDGVAYSSRVFNTPSRKTVEYFFDISAGDVISIDIGGTLASQTSTPFEFYGDIKPQKVEELPDRLEYFVIPNNDYGVPNRKRHTSYKFQIYTYGQPVLFTPFVDGVAYAGFSFSTSRRQTVEYFFIPQDVIGIDIGGTLQSVAPTLQPFEFYGTVVPQTVEQLPDRLEYFVIPATNYGTPNRKRHTSYKFQINTNGAPVLFTPVVDGTSYSTRTFNTPSRKTVEYFFDQAAGDVIGIDVGGTLQAQGTPFEYYGNVLPQKVEQLPDRLEWFRIPNTNLEIAAKKRFRTIPIIIDTYGFNVLFTPIVDGIELVPTVLNTNGKTTTYHYFSSDVFGTDIGGILNSNTVPIQPFEFYQLGQFEDVETLPVPKKYDQIGPIRFDKIGKIFTIRTKLISTGDTSILLNIYGDSALNLPGYGTPLYTVSFPVVPNSDQIYEINLPKSINTAVCRVTLGPTQTPFHRYDMTLRVSASGMETDSKWIPAR